MSGRGLERPLTVSWAPLHLALTQRWFKAGRPARRHAGKVLSSKSSETGTTAYRETRERSGHGRSRRCFGTLGR